MVRTPPHGLYLFMLIPAHSCGMFLHTEIQPVKFPFPKYGNIPKKNRLWLSYWLLLKKTNSPNETSLTKLIQHKQWINYMAYIKSNCIIIVGQYMLLMQIDTSLNEVTCTVYTCGSLK